MCIAVAYKKVKNRRGRLRELVFYQRFQLQGFDWEILDYFGLLDLCSLMGGSHLRDVVAHWGSTVLRMEWRWCELRKFKFKRKYDHRSGNCNRKKNFGTSTGFKPMASALALHCYTSWATKTQTLGTGQIADFFLTREWKQRSQNPYWDWYNTLCLSKNHLPWWDVPFSDYTIRIRIRKEMI